MSWGWARLAISAHATSPPATLPRHSCSLSVGLGLTPPLALGLSVGDASLYLDAMTPEGAGDEAGGMVLDAGGGPGGGDPESFESSAASTVSEGDGLEGMEV